MSSSFTWNGMSILCRLEIIHFSPFTSTMWSLITSLMSTKERAVKLANTNRARIYACFGSVNSCVITIFNSFSVKNSRSLTFGLIWNCANGFLDISLLK